MTEAYAEGTGLGPRGVIRVYLYTGIEIPYWKAIMQTHPRLSDRLRALTEVPNPAYVEAQRMGRSTYGIPPRLRTWRYRPQDDTFIIPHGLLDKLHRACWAMNLQLEVEDRRVTPQATPPPADGINLLPYQKVATAAVLKALQESGLALLESPPGSGKTEMGLWVLAQLPTRALWITHTLDLVRQVRERIMLRFGIPEHEIGLLGDQQRRLGEWITVGLVQTLSQLDLAVLEREFGAVVMDEVHHSPAATWSKILNSLAARYRLGVTGTLQRRDGLEEITHQLLGPTTHRVFLRDSQLPCTVHTYVIKGIVPEAWREHERKMEEYGKKRERYYRDMDLFRLGQLPQPPREPRKPQMPYSQIIEELLSHPERTKQVVELLVRIVPGRKTLVLSSRVQHCQTLAEQLRKALPDARIEVVYGAMPEEEREKILSAARAGRVDALFSVAIAKEGLDIPCLDQLVFVAGGRDPIYVQQAIGRIQRRYPGKVACDVWDVLDYDLPVLRTQYFARRRIYKQMGLILPERQRRTA